jgi:hypothetical protein
LPTVTAEVYGATDKARPEETRVFLGTTSYALPVLGMADLAVNQVRIVSLLRPEFAPGSKLLESQLIEPYDPQLVAGPGVGRAVVTADGQEPRIFDLKSGQAVAALQVGDRLLEVVTP